MENFWTYFEVLAPSIGVALIFWFVIRAIFRADRNERAAEAQIREEYAEQDAGPEDLTAPAEEAGVETGFQGGSQGRNT